MNQKHLVLLEFKRSKRSFFLGLGNFSSKFRNLWIKIQGTLDINLPDVSKVIVQFLNPWDALYRQKIKQPTVFIIKTIRLRNKYSPLFLNKHLNLSIIIFESLYVEFFFFNLGLIIDICIISFLIQVIMAKIRCTIIYMYIIYCAVKKLKS